MDLVKFKGVCFRYYTQREAHKLGLRGWCYNHPDESVEGLAAGDADAIKRFKHFLYRGPPSAKVDKVELDDTPNVSEAELKQMGVSDKFEVVRYPK